MTIGHVYAPEWREYRDPETNRKVTQLTNSPDEDYHLYYYNPTVTADGQYLIFFSERTGLNNLYRLELASGEIVQLTDAQPVRGEYWPFTSTVKGVGACLAAIGSGGREVFYWEGTQLFGVDIRSFKRRLLLKLPADRRPSMLNADASGKTLVFGTWDEAVFLEGSRRNYAFQPIPDDAFFQQGASTIMRVNTETEQAEELLRLEHFWTNHVLVNPYNPDLILFTHEFLEGSPDRMWIYDKATGECGPLAGQPPSEWFMHEFWSRDGKRVVFHGGQVDKRKSHGFCGWCAPDGTGWAKFEHTFEGRAYAHYNLHPDGQTMITDGEARPGCISKIHLKDGKQEFEVLCRHDSYRYGDEQRCHPHPSFTPDGKRVIFTSNHSSISHIFITDWE
jgi:oligogalacturonide lyase